MYVNLPRPHPPTNSPPKVPLLKQILTLTMVCACIRKPAQLKVKGGTVYSIILSETSSKDQDTLVQKPEHQQTHSSIFL